MYYIILYYIILYYIILYYIILYYIILYYIILYYIILYIDIYTLGYSPPRNRHHQEYFCCRGSLQTFICNWYLGEQPKYSCQPGQSLASLYCAHAPRHFFLTTNFLLQPCHGQTIRESWQTAHTGQKPLSLRDREVLTWPARLLSAPNILWDLI